MDAFEGQTKKLILNARVQGAPAESCEDRCHVIRAAKEVNDFSSRIVF